MVEDNRIHKLCDLALEAVKEWLITIFVNSKTPLIESSQDTSSVGIVDLNVENSMIFIQDCLVGHAKTMQRKDRLWAPENYSGGLDLKRFADIYP